ncbi:MAG: damage-inducible protein DinB [Burkholderiales bacterium]|nr:damage-inducible protein DinB [Burkholderiales bacterium]
MITPDYCRYFARYNRWQNESLYAAAAKLPDGTRKRNMGAFFKSIHGTLNHLLVADRLWLSRLDGEPHGVTALDLELYSDFDELRAQRAFADDRLDRYVATLTPARLASELTWRRMSDGGTEVTSRIEGILPHVFNHQTHHRGQVTPLLMQCGVDPGVTDLPRLPPDFVSPVFGQ